MHSRGIRGELPELRRGAKALADFRRQLSEVLVPGEEEAWLRTLQQELDGIDEAVRAWFARCSSDAERVLEQDRELGARVEDLRRELEELDAEWSVLLEQARTLQASVESGPAAAGAGLPEHVERLRNSASSWLDRLEHHEASSRAWFLESLYRDRGAVD